MCISFHRVYKATVYKLRRLLLFRLISDRVFLYIVQFFFSIVCMLLVSVMIFIIFIVVICGNNIHE